MSLPIPQDNLLLPSGRISQSWQRFLQMLKSQIGDVTQYTPDVGASSGVITTWNATGRYQQIGKQVSLWGQVQVTNNGTGAGALLVFLPSRALYSPNVAVGCATQPTGAGTNKSMQAFMGTPLAQFPFSNTAVSITNPDGTYPAAGQTISFSIVYEVN